MSPAPPPPEATPQAGKTEADKQAERIVPSSGFGRFACPVMGCYLTHEHTHKTSTIDPAPPAPSPDEQTCAGCGEPAEHFNHSGRWPKCGFPGTMVAFVAPAPPATSSAGARDQEAILALTADVESLSSTLREARVLLVRYHSEPMCSREARAVCGTCITLDEIDAALRGDE